MELNHVSKTPNAVINIANKATVAQCHYMTSAPIDCQA